MTTSDLDLSQTSLRRLEQHRDRWSSFGGTSGILALSDKPSVEALRRIDLFDDLDDRFLESISPDLSLARWQGDAVLFEQGTYIDLAFFVLEGEVEVSYPATASGSYQVPAASPIFDAERTSGFDIAAVATGTVVLPPSRKSGAPTPSPGAPPRRAEENTIGFLAHLDVELDQGQSLRLGPGELFGEIGAMSGWPQSVTARTRGECQLLQIRVPALRALKRRSKALKQRLDQLYRERALHRLLLSTPLFQSLGEEQLRYLEKRVQLVSLQPGEELVHEGEKAEALYVVRSGFLKVRQGYGEGELVVTYLSKGMTLGEVELMIDGIDGYDVSVSSVEFAELIEIPTEALRQVWAESPAVRETLWQSVVDRLGEIGASRRDPGRSGFIQTALENGLVQGNSILMIDLDRCTRCDDCVRACAATHGGRPRFIREGEKLESFLVPRSCYHCRDPVCLVGCPTGAIHRTGASSVIDITDEVCIGCATCANNCPYDAIVMHDTGETWPADMVPTSLRGEDRRVASKCDLCQSTGHDPACVSNCPQGCAFRVGSVDEIRGLLTHSLDDPE